MPGEWPFLLGTGYLASTGVASYLRAGRRKKPKPKTRYKGKRRRGMFG